MAGKLRRTSDNNHCRGSLGYARDRLFDSAPQAVRYAIDPRGASLRMTPLWGLQKTGKSERATSFGDAALCYPICRGSGSASRSQCRSARNCFRSPRILLAVPALFRSHNLVRASSVLLTRPVSESLRRPSSTLSCWRISPPLFLILLGTYSFADTRKDFVAWK